MLFRDLFLILSGLLFLTTPLAAHQEPTLGKGWQLVKNLSKGPDRDQIQSVLDKEYGCRGVPTRRASFSEGYPQFINKGCQKAEIRKLPIGNDQDLIAIGLPTSGNCGDFDFTFLSPADENGQRHILKGPNRGQACGMGLRDVPGQTPFKIVIEGLDSPPGPNSPMPAHNNVNTLFVWDGTDLKQVR